MKSSSADTFTARNGEPDHSQYHTESSDGRSKQLIASIFLGSLMLGCQGCQTFNLTSDEWAQQQRGQMVDPATGTAVGVLAETGTAAYVAYELLK